MGAVQIEIETQVTVQNRKMIVSTICQRNIRQTIEDARNEVTAELVKESLEDDEVHRAVLLRHSVYLFRLIGEVFHRFELWFFDSFERPGILTA